MSLLIDIAAFSLGLFGLLMLCLQLTTLWLGNRLGRWRARRLEASDRDQVERIGVILASLLALLGFTLGLVISIAESRYDERRLNALNEANAIGTAWLRAHAVHHPRGEAIARLLEDYTRQRIAWLEAPRDSAALEAATRATGQAQTVIWGHAQALARERTDAVAQGLLAALNDTFDLATAQRWAFTGQLPVQLPWLLLTLTFVSVGSIGYQWGLRQRSHPLVALLLLGAWTGCLMLIADLGNARIGWVRVSAAPFHWTLQGFQGGVPIPPAP